MNTVVVREGLLGGVLNARWPLLDVGGRRASVSYEGLTKLGGRELHRLRYRAKQSQGALEVMVFLDPASYQHVATVYSLSQQKGVVTGAANSSDRELVFRLEERFSDFVRFGARALPKTWTLVLRTVRKTQAVEVRDQDREPRRARAEGGAFRACRVASVHAGGASTRGRVTRDRRVGRPTPESQMDSVTVSEELRATALHAAGTGLRLGSPW